MAKHSSREGMEAPCKKALELSNRELVEELDVIPVADFLKGKGVLGDEHYQDILAGKTAYHQRRTFLKILPQRGQRAFDEFCTFLGEEENQPWLRNTICEHLESNAHLSRRKIKEGLVPKVHHFVQNDPSQVLKGSKKPAYIEQPVSFKADVESSQEGETTGSILKLLKKATPGERYFIYAAAGMGKSTLCRWIAGIWADKNNELYKRYDYIFPIPLSTVQSDSLEDIICKDNGLISKSCMKRVQLEPNKILFIVDSYEEKSHDPSAKKTKAIDELITGEIFKKSTVITTSRPTAEIKVLAEKAKSATVAELQCFTEEQARNYIRSSLNEEACSKTERLYGMSFLQRPINLWLVCYFIAQQSNGKNLKIPKTQTVLVNCIVQHIMLAYATKRKLSGFTKSESLPLKMKEPPEVRSILIVLGMLCYKALRHGSYTLQINEGPFSLEEIMNIGLFIEGPEGNSVTLPHRVFQEYLAAVYLSYDSYARQALIQELGLTVEARPDTDKPSLEELLKPLELSGAITFLVGLLPNVIDDLRKFFVIKQRRIEREIQPELQYELALLHECPDKGVKSVIAKALLKAPVSLDAPEMLTDDYTMNTWAYEILEHLAEDECLELLGNAYGLDRLDEETNKQPTLLAKKHLVLDSFPVSFIHRFNNRLQAGELVIVNAHMPGQLMRQNLGSVLSLYLEGCTLCEEMPIVDGIRQNLTTAEDEEGKPLKRLYLQRCRGLDALPKMRPAQTLSISQTSEGCELTSLAGKAESVFLTDTRLMYSSQPKMTSVTELNIWRCPNVKLSEIAKVCDHLEDIIIRHSVTAAEPTTEWRSVKHLEMDYCSLKTAGNQVLNEQQAEICLKQMCPQASIKLKHYKGQLELGVEFVALFDYEGREKGDFKFRKGDVFKVSQLKDSHRALATNKAGQRGMIPVNYVSRRGPVPLEKFTWFHADVERTEILNRFRLHPDANYLVAYTCNQQNQYSYVLWVHHGSRLFSYDIKNKDNALTIDGEKLFRNLPRLVEYYTNRTDTVCLCTRLRCGVPDSTVHFFVDENSFAGKGWAIQPKTLQDVKQVDEDNPKGEVIFSGRYHQDVITIRQLSQESSIGREREKALVEPAILTRLKHPNVVAFYGVALGDTVRIVTEYMAYGSLKKYLEQGKEKRKLPKFASQICRAMSNLEQENLLHRSLMAQDVWIHENGTAKLFNLWQVRPVTDVQSGGILADRWMAPEVLQKQPFTHKSDVWSYGVVLWEIYSNGQRPYPTTRSKDESLILGRLANGMRLEIPDGCPKVMSDIMKAAWAWDAQERPTFSTILRKLEKHYKS